ncbi:MAG: anthranilate phosphoribosyltransferase [Nitrospira sp.]|nr:anthranilate phosphoribosyltransferase [Nitrospira sp.]
MIRDVLAKLADRTDLSAQEAETVMAEIMDGAATPAQIAAYLMGLRQKGETVDEIVGSVKAMRSRAVRISVGAKIVVDTCGTGGDGAHTFNISTTAALVAAGAGLTVAKHGNRSISSQSGSADLLTALGVKIDLAPGRVADCIDEVGIGFLFAPLYHEAMKHCAGAGVELVGSSPEILVRCEDGLVSVRPIAGTRRRGTTVEEDTQLERRLLADTKERAEHIMLVDLGRNDVGRVAERGSVQVESLMNVERYSHVMHIVSNVTGKLDKSKTAYDVLKACFPAGTVSGAPKIRAMEIIEELEPTKRGPYAGAVGYLSFSGNMDMCINIRTVVVSRRRAFIQAGAGIVADSNPEHEYEETCNKTRAMMKAIELAEQGLE